MDDFARLQWKDDFARLQWKLAQQKLNLLLKRVDTLEPTLWLVGQYHSGEIPNIVWEFQGVFDSKQKALAACRNEYYFVAPVVLNEEIPDDTYVFPGLVYPKEDE